MATEYGTVPLQQENPMQRQHGPNREVMNTAAQAQVKAHQLPALKYDITSCGFMMLCGSETLYIDPEEVKYVGNNCCADLNFVRPYGELGGVDDINQCGCCIGWRYTMVHCRGAKCGHACRNSELG